jgi:flagellar basal-body rod protein FlgC
MRVEVISQNIANAHTSRSPDGKPYQRQIVTFKSALRQAGGGGKQILTPTLQVGRVTKDPHPPVMVYESGHSGGEANLAAASRAFEANLAVIKKSQCLPLQILSIDKNYE